MARLLELLGVVWLPGLLFAAGLAALAVWLRRRSGGVSASGWLVLAGAGILTGLGGLTMPANIGFWLALVAGALLFGKFVWLVITGQWLTPLGALFGGLTLYGLGGW